MVTLLDNVLLPDGARGHIAYRDGDIISCGSREFTEVYDEYNDGCGALLMPGLVDAHVHFREPGLTHKATVSSESRAAAAGGAVVVMDMPNTVPATDSRRALEDKIALYRCDCVTDFRCFVTPGKEFFEDFRDGLPDQCCGVKIFMGSTTGNQAPLSQGLLEGVFDYCAERNIPVMVHAEDNGVIARNTDRAKAGNWDLTDISNHARVRDAEACLRSTAQAVELATKYGTRLHIAHITTAREVREFLTTGPVAQKRITAEATPLHLLMGESDYRRLGTRIKVNPAVKTDADRDALRQALMDGYIDTIGTDHAPHLLAEKQGDIFTAASGAPMIQFGLVALLGLFTPQLLAEKMAANPAQIFLDSRYGNLHPGSRANFTLVEKTAPWKITDSAVLSPCGWTPLAGMSVSHRILRTVLRGSKIF